jgi:methyl-accepting chemotaxis protein
MGNYMGNLSIRHKLLALVMVAILGVVVSALFGWLRVSSMHAELLASQVKHSQMLHAVEKALDAQTHFKTQVQEWKNILLRGKDAEAYGKHLKAFNEESEKVIKNLAETQVTVGEMGLAGEINVAEVSKTFGTLTPAYLEALKLYRELVESGGDAAGTVDKAVKGKDREPAKAITDLVQQLEKAGAAAMEAEKAHADEILIETRNRTLLTLVISVAICAGVAMVIVSSITTPVSALEKTMSDIARTNNLTLRADVSNRDEIGQMGQVFNTMVAKLQEVVQHVGQASNEVNRAAHDLTGSANMLNSAVETQASTVSSNAASIEELTVSIATVSDTAAAVSEKSSQSVRNTSEGNSKVVSLVSEIRAIQANVSQIASSVEEFVKSTSAITGMTKEVREIADQTNLLALNAAIEAARAGEQGRGFAVVADEVRKLAEKSGSSAGEIDGVAQAIISQSEQVRKSIDAGLQSIEASARLAVDVEQTLNQARESVEQSGRGVDEIAASVNEQKNASTEIARNMEHIASASEEASQTAQSVSATAEELKRAANDLSDSIAGFTV